MKRMRNKTCGNLPNTMPDVCREPTRLELNIMLNAGRLPRALRALVMTADIELWV